MIVRVKDRQSLVDLALMATGAVEGVWALALRNGLSVTGELGYGMELTYESDDVADARTAARYASEGIEPATEVSGRVLEELLREPVVKRRAAHEVIKADEVRPEPTRAAVFAGEFTAAFA